ncbi:hypothetical protein [Halobacillus sp. BAB-2008]|uniref:hypothetical protein n=1 Tax=Halobacillus sp. BAB-2008 TaxID=1246484 RepID=UPI0019D340A1|nr:hypothetical protein [Halobacillus sp. BAB-2008]
MILKGFKKCYKDFTFDDIPEKKLEILIKLYVIYMNTTNLDFMRENYPDQLMFFIYSNIRQYASEVIDEDNFSISELLSLLDTDIKDSYKFKLLEYTSEPISVKRRTCSEEIKLHILKHNLDINDIPFLIGTYEQESPNIKDMICTICIENINKVLREEYELPYDLLIILLKSEGVHTEEKTKLLIPILKVLIKHKQENV